MRRHRDVELTPAGRLCVGMVPAHQVMPWIERGELVALQLKRPFPASPSCVAWAQNKLSPTMAWLLDYLGDTRTLNQEWLNGPDPITG